MLLRFLPLILCIYYYMLFQYCAFNFPGWDEPIRTLTLYPPLSLSRDCIALPAKTTPQKGASRSLRRCLRQLYPSSGVLPEWALMIDTTWPARRQGKENGDRKFLSPFRTKRTERTRMCLVNIQHSRHKPRMNFLLNLAAHFPFDDLEVVTRLQVQPELGCGAEVTGQP